MLSQPLRLNDLGTGSVLQHSLTEPEAGIFLGDNFNVVICFVLYYLFVRSPGFVLFESTE
nr:hypothetical protein [Leptolyngbya sp. NK1-12]